MYGDYNMVMCYVKVFVATIMWSAPTIMEFVHNILGLYSL